MSRHPEPDEPSAAREDEIISLVEADGDDAICFIAAGYPSEIPLVEIHSQPKIADEIKHLQEADSDINKVIELIKAKNTDINAWKSIPNWFIQSRYGFVVHDGVLYHTKVVDSHDQPLARTVIPEAKRMEMLYRAHGHLQSGHPSAQRALARLEKFATWPGMTRAIKEHVTRCAECQAVRSQIPKKVAPVEAQEATAPLQYVQADLYYVGKSHNKNDYVLVMEDRATKQSAVCDQRHEGQECSSLLGGVCIPNGLPR